MAAYTRTIQRQREKRARAIRRARAALKKATAGRKK